MSVDCVVLAPIPLIGIMVLFDGSWSNLANLFEIKFTCEPLSNTARHFRYTPKLFLTETIAVARKTCVTSLGFATDIMLLALGDCMLDGFAMEASFEGWSSN